MATIAVMNPPALDNKAFTLLELILVMVIMAITVSFAAPQLAGFLYTDQFKVSMRQLTGLVNEASQTAQRERATYLLRYTASTRRFVVEPEVEKEENTPRAKEPPDMVMDSSIAVKDLWSQYGGTRSVDEFAVRFTKDGYVEPTIIHFKEKGSREFSLVLAPFLGRIRIENGYVDPEQDGLFQ